MKKLTILSSAIAFLLLSSITAHSKAMAQNTQKDNSTNTEQVSSDSNIETQSGQKEDSNDTQEDTDSSDQKEDSTDTKGRQSSSGGC